MLARLRFRFVHHYRAAFHDPFHLRNRHINVRQRVAFHGHQVGKVTRSDRSEFLFFP